MLFDNDIPCAICLQAKAKEINMVFVKSADIIGMGTWAVIQVIDDHTCVKRIRVSLQQDATLKHLSCELAQSNHYGIDGPNLIESVICVNATKLGNDSPIMSGSTVAKQYEKFVAADITMLRQESNVLDLFHYDDIYAAKPAFKDALISTVKALHILHSNGVLHEDISPLNILTGRTTKLADFGLSNFFTRSEQINEVSQNALFRPDYFTENYQPHQTELDITALAKVASYVFGWKHPVFQYILETTKTEPTKVTAADIVEALTGSPPPPAPRMFHDASKWQDDKQEDLTPEIHQWVTNMVYTILQNTERSNAEFIAWHVRWLLLRVKGAITHKTASGAVSITIKMFEGSEYYVTSCIVDIDDHLTIHDVVQAEVELLNELNFDVVAVDYSDL